jgi:hypothetical protein
MKRITKIADVVEIVNDIRHSLGEIPQGFSINVEMGYNDYHNLIKYFNQIGIVKLHSFSIGVCTLNVSGILVKLICLPEDNTEKPKLNYGRITEV